MFALFLVALAPFSPEDVFAIRIVASMWGFLSFASFASGAVWECRERKRAEAEAKAKAEAEAEKAKQSIPNKHVEQGDKHPPCQHPELYDDVETK